MLLMPFREPACAARAADAAVVSVPLAGVLEPLRFLSVLGLVALAGCGGLEPTTHVEADPTRLYMALTLEVRAINMATTAPYNTIQLTATPRDGRDSVISDLPAPTFRLANPGDATVLQVTPQGLVTALGAASGIPVIAELVGPGPVRYADTAWVNVTADPPPVLDSLSIEPVSPESALWSIIEPVVASTLGLFVPELAGPSPLSALALDPMGQPIGGLVVEYASLDPRRAAIGSNEIPGGRFRGNVTAFRPGPVQVTARTWAYGVTKVDTAIYTVRTAPGVVVQSTMRDGAGVFGPSKVWIPSHGVVVWNHHMTSEADVTFDEPAQVTNPAADEVVPLCFILPNSCGAGNILLPPYEGGITLAVRRFPSPGIYTYHSLRTGATGQVIVTDELPPGADAP